MKWVLPPGTGGRHQHGRLEGAAEEQGEPRGSGRGRYGRGWSGNDQTPRPRGPKTWLGRSRHEWGDVHFWLAMALLAGLVWHVILHWSWITGSVRCAWRAGR